MRRAVVLAGGGYAASAWELGLTIAELQAALRIKPRDAVALNTLAALLQLEGKLEDAQSDYRAAIEARPDYADAKMMAVDAPAEAPVRRLSISK